MPSVQEYLRAVVSPYPGLGANSAARVIKIVTILICSVVSLVSFFKRSAQYSVSHSKVMIMIFSYAAMITLLLALFSYGGYVTNILLIMVPVSLVIYDYLVWGAADRECRIAAAFLALAVLLEYIFAGIR